MKLHPLTVAAIAALALTGCTSVPPATLSQPPAVQQPVQPASAAHAPDESGYLLALQSGTSPAGLVSSHAELRAATLEAGYGACQVIASSSSPELGMLQVLEFAEQHLDGDPFTADMPALFTAAATVHLCGITP